MSGVLCVVDVTPDGPCTGGSVGFTVGSTSCVCPWTTTGSCIGGAMSGVLCVVDVTPDGPCTGGSVGLTVGSTSCVCP